MKCKHCGGSRVVEVQVDAQARKFKVSCPCLDKQRTDTLTKAGAIRLPRDFLCELCKKLISRVIQKRDFDVDETPPEHGVDVSQGDSKLRVCADCVRREPSLLGLAGG